MMLQYAGDPRLPPARPLSFAADIIAQNGRGGGGAWTPGSASSTGTRAFRIPAIRRRPCPTSPPVPDTSQCARHGSATPSGARWSGGAYIDSPDSGEQAFNEGSIAVVAGDQPIIANGSGWLPQVAGTAGEDYVYNDEWGAKTRKLANSFFVNDPSNIYNPGQGSVGPDTARTHVERYEDRGGYVRAPAPPTSRTCTPWAAPGR